MTTIHRLDEGTIGRIAAGEIIERPASVVKELVENAIDARARRVVVAVERGGLGLIEVTDDGDGIPAADLPLALYRHATSKLSEAEDLERIATLGFRGEGLASIAAVARVELLSCERDATVGASVTAFGERLGDVEPAAVPPGTRVRVRSLFENVPVRREYLRAAGAEFGRISSWLASVALGYPRIGFTLRHDGAGVWVMPPTDDERERLAMVFGRDAAKALLPLAQSAARSIDGRLRGFVSAPGSERSDRRMQLLFVNGRLLRGALLAGAWSGGYGGYAMLGRHPYGVLFLDLPPDHVDANVHPTKSEVRLRYAGQVSDAVRRSIAATLREHASERFARSVAGPSAADASALPHGEPISFLTAEGAGGTPATAMRVLAQLDRTFILASDGEALLLVDQHAAHERIAYEAIVERARRGDPGEPLLVPHVVELDAERSAALEAALEALREGGLEIEPFGERTYRIVATPAGDGGRRFDLAGVLDDLTAEPKQREVRERIWASLACHSVTVAGERLAETEMATLVARLQTCANPMHCPHGRPTMVRLAPQEIARMFKRV